MSSPSAPSAGDRLGRYRVVERIGTGGMAEVFKCRLSGMGGFEKLVVIKRIRPELAREPNFVAMFLDEARIGASLNHPNIIQTLEIDQAAGLPFLVMEYERGPTLDQLTREAKRRGEPNLAVAAKVMAGVCAALDCAHTAVGEDGSPLEIIHRDVTPQNILISLDGIPKLLDFGVARARGQLAATAAGSLKGKFAFLPPEAFLGERAQVTRQLDVFGAGVCLYHATTCHLPYRGETEAQVLRAAAAGKFSRPSEVVPGFCPRLEEIILWAMAPSAKDRCPDALTLHRQLEEYAQQRGCTQSMVRELVRELFPLDPRGEPEGCSSIHDADIVKTPPPHASPRHPARADSQAVPAPGLQCGSKVWHHHWRPALPVPLGKPLGAAVRPVAAGELAGPGASPRAPTLLLLALVAVVGAGILAGRPLAPPAHPEAMILQQAPEPLLACTQERAPLQSSLLTPAAPAPLLPLAPAPLPPSQPDQPAASRDRGWLTVETSPSAMVFVDGTSLGWSPVRRSVSPGIYQVGLRHEDRQPMVLDAKVRAGGDTRLQLRLVEKPATTRTPAGPIAATPITRQQVEE